MNTPILAMPSLLVELNVDAKSSISSQLLAKSSRSLSGPSSLQSDDLDQID